MMREALLRRLEALEKSRRTRDRAATQIIHITFPPLDPQYAEGPHGFICYPANHSMPWRPDALKSCLSTSIAPGFRLF
jgi:hypothetical protein